MHDPTPTTSQLFGNLLLSMVIVTTIATGGIGWFTFKSSDKLIEIQKQSEEIVKTQGIITHYDEILTMSARMSAATGNEKWESRYRQFEPLLEQELKKLISLQPKEIKSAEDTNTANTRLVTMEKQALRLVQENKLTEASQILFSAEYEKQKEIYNHGTSDFYKNIQNTLNYLQDTHQKRADVLKIVLFLFLSVSLWGWIFIFQKVRLWNQELNSINENLDQKVKEQTALLLYTAKMSALGEMAGGVAHEINTPLAIIRIRAEQIEECLKDGDTDSIDFMGAIGVIKDTVDRIAKIINGLRFFSREEKVSGTQKVSVSKLIEETLSFCSERFRNHGIQLEIVEAHKNMQIECRPVEISQVFLNLLNNSYDAIENVQKKWIRIEAVQNGQCLEISFTDSGGGIPQDIQNKIMQPFFTTKELGKGTGLGLSISKGIIQAHQGKLYVDNNSPNTKFTIRLPKVQNKTDDLIFKAA